MLKQAIERVLHGWSAGPASEEQLRAVERMLGVVLPQQYRQILLISNGVPTWGEVVLYETDRLLERNRDWAEIPRYAPEYVAIGDDSGGRVLLMRAERNATAVELCDVACVSERADYVRVTDDLHTWLIEAQLELEEPD